jgi:hypothetical protein
MSTWDDRAAFEHLHTVLGRLPDGEFTETELLTLLEAASHLDGLVERVRKTAIPAARAAGVSWSRLGAAMGVTRSTAQYRYEKATERQAADWAGSDETPA